MDEVLPEHTFCMFAHVSSYLDVANARSIVEVYLRQVPVDMIPSSNTSKELYVASTKLIRTEIQKTTIRKDAIYLLVRPISITFLLHV